MSTCSSNSNYDHHHHNHYDHEQAAGKQRAPSLPLLGLPERAQPASGHSSWLWKHTFVFALLAAGARGIWKAVLAHQQHCKENLFWDGDGHGWGGENMFCKSYNFTTARQKIIVQSFVVHLILDLPLSFYNSIFVFSQHIIKPWETEYESIRIGQQTRRQKDNTIILSWQMLK